MHYRKTTWSLRVTAAVVFAVLTSNAPSGAPPDRSSQLPVL